MLNKSRMKFSKILMIVWAKPGTGSRRALEVSDRLGWTLHYSFPRKTYPIIYRYFWCLFDSIKKIMKDRPDLLVIQIGPSIACIAGIFAAIIYNIPVVYDSHSSVYMSGKEAYFRWLRKIAFSLSLSVLIHNDGHAAEVMAQGGKPTVLRDPLPRFPEVVDHHSVSLKTPSVFCPLGWRPDEPIEAIIEAAKKLKDFNFYLTGMPRKKYDYPDNIILTGLLSSESYVAHLTSCDVLLALTTQENTVCCAGHEAIAAKRPLVTSDTKVLRDRFDRYAFFSSSDPNDIALRISEAFKTAKDMAVIARLIESAFEDEWIKNSWFLKSVEQ